MKTFDKLSKAAMALSLAGFFSTAAMADSKIDDLTGFFVGVELGYSSSVRNYLSIGSGSSFDYGSKELGALAINLVLGYQIYPWQHAGFKFKGYAGPAVYDATIQFKDETDPAKQRSSAIHYGLEAEYLYDFIAGQIHTLGLNFGLGYEFGTFIKQGLEIPSAEANSKEHFHSYTSSSLISSLGVHYYYNINHQFELKYRYRSGYAQDNGGSQTIQMEDDLQNVKYATTPKG